MTKIDCNHGKLAGGCNECATDKAGRKLRANNEVPSGYGKIEDVNALLRLWFPGDNVEAIETAPAGWEGGDGYMRFNLVVTFGTVTQYVYAKGQTYKNFAAPEIARDMGILDCAHATRHAIESLRKSAAIVDDVNAAAALRRAWLDSVAFMGWHLAK